MLHLYSTERGMMKEVTRHQLNSAQRGFYRIAKVKEVKEKKDESPE